MAEHAQTPQLTGESGLAIHMVTPKGPVAETRTDAITAPGALGEFEVLPGHVPFLTGLHPGVLTLGEKMDKSHYAVSIGYVRVNEDGGVEVLVEQAVPADKVDVKAAEADKKEVEVELQQWSGSQNAEWRNLKERYDWAQAQLDAAEKVA
jgi:F-type H+-transporting ATPase subunit epsilon